MAMLLSYFIMFFLSYLNLMCIELHKTCISFLSINEVISDCLFYFWLDNIKSKLWKGCYAKLIVCKVVLLEKSGKDIL